MLADAWTDLPCPTCRRVVGNRVNRSKRCTQSAVDTPVLLNHGLATGLGRQTGEEGAIVLRTLGFPLLPVPSNLTGCPCSAISGQSSRWVLVLSDSHARFILSLGQQCNARSLVDLQFRLSSSVFVKCLHGLGRKGSKSVFPAGERCWVVAWCCGRCTHMAIPAARRDGRTKPLIDALKIDVIL